MHLHHQSMLPYSYYDKYADKIMLKLITGSDVTAVKLLYGDPFAYVKTDNLSPEGNHIWEWEYSELPLTRQYDSPFHHPGLDPGSHLVDVGNIVSTVAHISQAGTWKRWVKPAMTNIMWRISLLPPKTKRLKYAFIVTDKNNKSVYFGEKGVMPVPESSDVMHSNIFFFPFVHKIDALHIPQWASETCWYQIFPERFYNGNPSISPKSAEDWEKVNPKSNCFFGGDLHGIIQKLPYLHELGITGIYLTPVFESPSNHKYDTKDYFKIDPHFGDTKTLKELADKAHALGMKIMLDGVFNHIGSSHPFWQDVLKNQEKSKYKDYFHIHSFPILEKYPTREEINYDTFSFVPNMPKWNTENPEARQYLLDIATYWVKKCDIDGWRLDVSDEVSFDFWHEFKRAVTGVKPDIYILGEVWHDPSKWLNGYFHAVMNYPLGNMIKDLFITKTLAPDAFTQGLFAKLMSFSDIHSRVQYNLMDSHDTARILTQAKGDKLAIKNAFLFMFLMKGAPSIYYSTEIGMEGGEDPDCRRPMIWDTSKQDLELLGFFKELIALRKRYNNLIQNADITYARDKGLCRWSLRYGHDRLDIVYNSGEEDLPLEDNVLLTTHGSNTKLLLKTTCAVEIVTHGGLYVTP